MLRRLRFASAGYSHGPGILALLDGMPAGLPLETAWIDHDLQRRQRGYGRGHRMALESDKAQLLSGVYQGRTDGSPIAIFISNREHEGARAPNLQPLYIPRPGHADFAGYAKYSLPDCRPVWERASARETAARVAAGAVARRLLHELGIRIGSYVQQIGSVALEPNEEPTWALVEAAERSDVRCPLEAVAERMRSEIDTARQAGDSVGGVFVVLAEGLPPGLGSYSQWECRLDARLGGAILSIPGVKGIEIGPAFANAGRPGTEVQDPIGPAEPVTRVGSMGALRQSNNSGGVEGGMSTGQRLVVRAAMKPIPTTLAPQPSIDLRTGAAAETEYRRSDICAVPAAAVVGEAMVSLVLADAVLEKFGGDSLLELLAAYSSYVEKPLFGRASWTGADGERRQA